MVEKARGERGRATSDRSPGVCWDWFCVQHVALDLSIEDLIEHGASKGNSVWYEATAFFVCFCIWMMELAQTNP